MSEFVRLPRIVKLRKYLSQICLQETLRLCEYATNPQSPLYDEIQKLIPENEAGERAVRTAAIADIGGIIRKEAQKGGLNKGPHVNIPGYVPLENFVSRVVLEELWRLTWLAAESESPLYATIQQQLPGDAEYKAEAVKALKMLGVVAKRARRKCI